MNSRLEKLRAFGDVRDGIADKLVYATGASQSKYNIEAVVTPHTVEQIAGLVRFALRRGLHLIPRGGGSSLMAASHDDESIIVDLAKMHNVIETGQDDVVVESGIVLSNLNAQLDPYDSEFPIIPDTGNVAQLGGLVAMDALGRREMLGRMRDWVQEIIMVDGTGKVLRITDPRPICGKEGTLGIITQVKCRTSQCLTETTADLEPYPTVDKLLEAYEKALKTEGVLMIEFIDKHMAVASGMRDAHYLLVEYRGDQGALKGQGVERAMTLRSRLRSILHRKHITRMEDVYVPSHHYVRFIRYLISQEIPCTAKLGNGFFHPFFRAGKEREILEMYKRVQSLDGSLIGEFGIGKQKKAYIDPELADKFNALKEKYDPFGVFNRGLIYG